MNSRLLTRQTPPTLKAGIFLSLARRATVNGWSLRILERSFGVNVSIVGIRGPPTGGKRQTNSNKTNELRVTISGGITNGRTI